jgi:hypothetical protein
VASKTAPQPQRIALRPQGHLDICPAIKHLWPLQKSHKCIWCGVDKKFLNDTYMLREPGLMNSSSTQSLLEAGVWELSHRRKISYYNMLLNSPEFVESEIQVEK